LIGSRVGDIITTSIEQLFKKFAYYVEHTVYADPDDEGILPGVLFYE